MALASGAQLGKYRVLGPLGSGGMGEVYRARDDHLGRDVAVKVLRTEVTADAERLRRFDHEARAAGALSHPNLVTVFDSGVHDGAPYLVFELLEGQTLRARLDTGAFSAQRAAELGAGIAEGLAAAHEKGIVHRDLKPENIVIGPDGRPKILDFGLAKLRPAAAGGEAGDLATRSRVTSPGTVMGSLAYMSPEQLEGRDVDQRSDIFSLGVVLYEALAGRHPFRRESLEGTVASILTQDPPLLAGETSGAAPALERIVRRCLEKRREARFQSARDLAFALQALAAPRPAGEATGPAPMRARRPGAGAGLSAALALLAVAGAYWLGRSGRPGSTQEFHRLSFRRGDVRAARFAPDGQTIVYSAAWGGGNYKLYSTREDSPESRTLDLPDAVLFSVSRAGEMAICLDQTSYVVPGDYDCTLARVALAGGAARPVLEHVRAADFSPDGAELAVIRRGEAGDTLEFPAGRVMAQGQGLSQVRIAPSGEWLAFLSATGSPERVLEVVRRDGSGRATLARGFGRGFGLAWSPDSREVWYTASDTGATHLSLYALDLQGRRRLVMALPGLANILDLAPDGRVLLSAGDLRGDLVAWAPGDERERLLSWLEFPRSVDFSPDGRTVFFSESGQGGGAQGAALYARGIDGSPAVRLGEGFGLDVSADGRLVAALGRSRGGASRELRAIPTGPGETRKWHSGTLEWQDARWLPKGDALLVAGREPGKPMRLWIVPEGGPPRPATPEGFSAGLPFPRGSAFVAQRHPDGALFHFESEGRQGQPLPGPPERGSLAGWSADGRALLVIETLFPGARILRRDLATGARVAIRELRPDDPTGVTVFRAAVSPAGDTFAAFYVRASTALFLARGLR